MKRSARPHLLPALLFAVYCLVMVWLLFVFHRRPYGIRSYNLIPLRTIRGYLFGFSRGWTSALLRYAVINLVGNITVFIPLGWFMPRLFARQRRFGVFIVSVMLIISAVEASQLIAAIGALDVDDLILNTFGAALGWIIWKISSRLYGRDKT